MFNNSNRFFIGGEWVAPSSGAQIDVITPSTEELFIRVAEAQEPDVNRAVAAARNAFDHGPWPRLSHAERANYLNAIGAEVSKRAAVLSDLWTSEVGSIKTFADFAMSQAGGIYHYYASLATTFPFEERHVPQMGGKVGLLLREPVGVVAAIVPWNGPLIMIAYKIAPALLAGCTVIIKSSPEAPGSAYIMAEIMEAVGMPPGVVNILTADREVSELLVKHPHVDKVTFTGSCAAGKKIAAICGERMARCTLELGGKSAAVILDDYDLEAAAQSLSVSARMMAGQVCSSLTRIIVSRSRQGRLAEAMRAAFSAIKVGDPYDAATDMGPLAMRRQRARVEQYIAKGLEEGARLVVGGKRPKHLDRGFYVEPTVFSGVDNKMTIAREEIFGPVVSIIPADDEDQAVEIANDTSFGLNASVFTHDAGRAYKLARKLRSGTVGHNAFRMDHSIGFGGYKQSGIGREGGVEGVYPFLESKTVILDDEPA